MSVYDTPQISTHDVIKKLIDQDVRWHYLVSEFLYNSRPGHVWTDTLRGCTGLLSEVICLFHVCQLLPSDLNTLCDQGVIWSGDQVK